MEPVSPARPSTRELLRDAEGDPAAARRLLLALPTCEVVENRSFFAVNLGEPPAELLFSLANMCEWERLAVAVLAATEYQSLSWAAFQPVEEVRMAVLLHDDLPLELLAGLVATGQDKVADLAADRLGRILGCDPRLALSSAAMFDLVLLAWDHPQLFDPELADHLVDPVQLVLARSPRTRQELLQVLLIGGDEDVLVPIAARRDLDGQSMWLLEMRLDEAVLQLPGLADAICRNPVLPEHLAVMAMRFASEDACTSVFWRLCSHLVGRSPDTSGDGSAQRRP
jgi:hypothetical protein